MEEIMDIQKYSTAGVENIMKRRLLFYFSAEGLI